MKYGEYATNSAVLAACTSTFTFAATVGDAHFFTDQLGWAAVCSALTAFPFVLSFKPHLTASGFLAHSGRLIAILAMFFITAGAIVAVVFGEREFGFGMLGFAAGAVMAGAVCTILWAALSLRQCKTKCGGKDGPCH